MPIAHPEHDGNGGQQIGSGMALPAQSEHRQMRDFGPLLSAAVSQQSGANIGDRKRGLQSGIPDATRHEHCLRVHREKQRRNHSGSAPEKTAADSKNESSGHNMGHAGHHPRQPGIGLD